MSKSSIVAGALIAAAALSCGPAQAQAQSLFAFLSQPAAPMQTAPQYAAVTTEPDDTATQVDPRLQRQVVAYPTREAPGTIVIDTPHTYLYYVLGNGQAIRYGIGVGRQGFTWSGVQSIARKSEWPDWYPPSQMIARQPYLPRVTAGGPGNPLGARAMYLGHSEYRIHGTNNPATIGKQVSSGCIRMTNEDVVDLYNRVKLGAKVVVLPMTGPTQVAHAMASSYAPPVPSSAQRTWANIR